MKPQKNELIRLQETWYKKLEDLGFKDIEKKKGDDWVLSEGSSRLYERLDPLSLKIREEYYEWLYRVVSSEQTIFRNDVDRFILCRHAEGIRIKQMVAELLSRGTPRNRNSVRFIIRRYELAWGLKRWNLKELNIKKKL